MEYTVHKLAQLAGVSERTLRYYDETGLLTPARITEAGYRIYGAAEVDLLQQILFYRELGLPLRDIARILHDSGFDPAAALRGHLAALEARRTRLDVLILTVRKTIASKERSESMNDREKFEGFKKKLLEENEKAYGAEVREKYGSDMAEASNKKFSGMSKEEYDAMTMLGEEIAHKLEAAVKAGLDPRAEEGQTIAALHHKWLSYTWPSYSREAHRGLAKMYVADKRFTAYYDANLSGCAAFLHDAILAYAV